MQLIDYDLAHSRWPRCWLMIAVLSLALAGIFSIILVIGRTPQLIAVIPELADLFHVSLVVHVDLSVLVWFLAMQGFLWSIYDHRYANGFEIPFFRAASWWCMLIGMIMMAIAPLSGEWVTLKSNYIPVLTNLLFFISLGLIMSATILQLIVVVPQWPRANASAQAIAIYGGAMIALAAMVAFILSGLEVPAEFKGLTFYEHLFWAGGHILQFAYAQSMLIAWVFIAGLLGLSLPPRRWLLAIMLINPLIILVTSFIPYMQFKVSDQEHMDYFTQQMIMGGGIAGTLLGLWLISQLIKRWHCPSHLRALRAALAMSLMLFFVGGIFGAAINGPNVRIPAHYHGSIVAVTLALVGLAYAALPALGYRAVTAWKMARCQPYLYGMGQLLHISGLAWSGGYGVLRKTAGDIGDGSWQVKAALGIMGGGGLLAIIGGLFFVIVMTRSFFMGRVISSAKDLQG